MYQYEKISVGFYHNDRKDTTGGITGWWKRGMNFWHTEVAFSPGLLGEIGKAKNRYFAYGIFKEHTELIDNVTMSESPKDNVITFSFKGTRKLERDNTMAVSSSSSVRGGYSKKVVSSVETHYNFHYPVDVMWRIEDVAYNRVSRKSLKYAKVKVFKKGGGRGGVVAVSVETPGIVFGKHRDFSNPSYTWLHFHIPKGNVLTAQRFANNQVGKPHNDWGVYKAVFWPGLPDYDSYYCVNLVASVLQKAGMLEGINPNALLPDDLYELLLDHPNRTTDINPFLVEQAKNKILK
jgi:hypothetical protein